MPKESHRKQTDSEFSNQERKLAAILFADIQGYTSLMQINEQLALSSLQKFKTQLDSLVPQHNGEIINFYGDGCLAIFNSSVDATACAKSLQLTFQTDPKVPVRIGLHAGDVVLRDDNVFGDAVNIASRIESMGVAGSVLLSSTVQNQIHNQVRFDVSPLGKFEFKHVNKPMTVYALRGEGLVVPEASQLEGKMKSPVKKESQAKWRWPIFVSVLLLIVAMAWMSGLIGGNAKALTPLDETNRQKRLAIPDFKNETNDAGLDAFGKMIADWATKGLMEREEINIISAENIKEQIQKTDLSASANEEFAKATGVDIVVLGKFYQLENDLIISADIVDLKTGKVLHPIQIQRKLEDKSTLLEELGQQLLSYWAVKDQKRFLEKPPKYEAYMNYLEGLLSYTSDPDKAIVQLEQAFELDTSFYAPIFSLIPLFERLLKEDKLKDAMAYLENREAHFSKWEQLKFEALQAMDIGDYLKAAMINDRLYQLDQSDARSNYSAAFLYNNANHPKKALEVLNDIDPRYVVDKGQAISWRSTQKVFAEYRLENYPPVVEIAKAYNNPKMFTVLAVFHLKVLVRMDSTEALANAFQDYKERGIYSPSGQIDKPDHMLLIICNEALITGNQAILHEYAAQLQKWILQNRVVNYPHHIPDIYNNRPLRQEEVEGFVHYYLGDYQKALAAWQKEKIPDSNWPDRVEQASRLGVCYAKLGKEKNALAQLEKIQSLQVPHSAYPRNQLYFSARILNALDQQQEAVESISQALDHGFIFFRPAVLDGDPFLKTLFDYPPFLELIKPKG